MKQPILFNDRWVYTASQTEAINSSYDAVVPMVEKLIQEAHKLWEAAHDPERAMNGSRNQCLKQSQYMMGAASYLQFIIDRDLYEILCWKHHFASGRFHTDEDWQKTYQHLDAEIARRTQQA